MGAKKDVLEDSDESNDEDSPVKKKGRQTKQFKAEKNGSEKKSSSKKKSSDGGDEKFMRVKLDASDSSDNEEKAMKRKDKIEAERENKKKKKAALESSDDEIMEVEAEGKSSPGKRIIAAKVGRKEA